MLSYNQKIWLPQGNLYIHAGNLELMPENLQKLNKFSNTQNALLFNYSNPKSVMLIYPPLDSVESLELFFYKSMYSDYVTLLANSISKSKLTAKSRYDEFKQFTGISDLVVSDDEIAMQKNINNKRFNNTPVGLSADEFAVYIKTGLTPYNIIRN